MRDKRGGNGVGRGKGNTKDREDAEQTPVSEYIERGRSISRSST